MFSQEKALRDKIDYLLDNIGVPAAKQEEPKVPKTYWDFIMDEMVSEHPTFANNYETHGMSGLHKHNICHAIRKYWRGRNSMLYFNERRISIAKQFSARKIAQMIEHFWTRFDFKCNEIWKEFVINDIQMGRFPIINNIIHNCCQRSS